MALESTVNRPRVPRPDHIHSCFGDQNEFLHDLLSPDLLQPQNAPHPPILLGPEGEKIVLIVGMVTSIPGSIALPHSGCRATLYMGPIV